MLRRAVDRLAGPVGDLPARHEHRDVHPPAARPVPRCLRGSTATSTTRSLRWRTATPPTGGKRLARAPPRAMFLDEALAPVGMGGVLVESKRQEELLARRALPQPI